jgi:hypothetical protein
VLQYLELVADYSEDMAKKIVELEIRGDKLPKVIIQKIIHLSEVTQTILQKSVDSLFTGDIRVANDVLELKKVLSSETDTMMHEAPGIPFLRAIISCLDKIADLGATTANIAINRALEQPNKYTEDIVRTLRHTRTVPLPKKKK